MPKSFEKYHKKLETHQLHHILQHLKEQVFAMNDIHNILYAEIKAKVIAPINEIEKTDVILVNVILLFIL